MTRRVQILQLSNGTTDNISNWLRYQKMPSGFLDGQLDHLLGGKLEEKVNSAYFTLSLSCLWDIQVLMKTLQSCTYKSQLGLKYKYGSCYHAENLKSPRNGCGHQQRGQNRKSREPRQHPQKYQHLRDGQRGRSLQRRRSRDRERRKKEIRRVDCQGKACIEKTGAVGTCAEQSRRGLNGGCPPTIKMPGAALPLPHPSIFLESSWAGRGQMGGSRREKVLR